MDDELRRYNSLSIQKTQLTTVLNVTNHNSGVYLKT